MPKIMDRIPCNKYQGERVKLLENIIRLVKPDKKMMMAMKKIKHLKIYQKEKYLEEVKKKEKKKKAQKKTLRKRRR